MPTSSEISPRRPALDDAASRPSWAAEIGRRVRYHIVLKTLGISAFMWVFFVAYFHLLRHPAHPITVMPLTALDRAIPFQPGALAAYVSLWLYVGIPPGLMLSLRGAALYGLWVGGLCLAGLAVFYVAPTAVPAFDFGPGGTSHAGFSLLQGVDASGNACPSLHVATATFTAIWVHHLLRVTGARPWLFVLNGLWLGLIVHSTLAIKQHVVLDVLAGALLAMAFAWASLRWRAATMR